jgi:hypothetical protein
MVGAGTGTLTPARWGAWAPWAIIFFEEAQG